MIAGELFVEDFPTISQTPTRELGNARSISFTNVTRQADSP